MAGHDGYTRYTVRIPDALYAKIKEAAGEKSVNAEILERLERSLEMDTPEQREFSLKMLDELSALSMKVRHYERRVEKLEQQFDNSQNSED